MPVVIIRTFWLYYPLDFLNCYYYLLNFSQQIPCLSCPYQKATLAFLIFLLSFIDFLLNQFLWISCLNQNVLTVVPSGFPNIITSVPCLSHKFVLLLFSWFWCFKCSTFRSSLGACHILQSLGNLKWNIQFIYWGMFTYSYINHVWYHSDEILQMLTINPTSPIPDKWIKFSKRTQYSLCYSWVT